MDEIKMFASLRPEGSSIDVLVREQLREELFGTPNGARTEADALGETPTATDGSNGTADLFVLDDERSSRRGGRRSPLLAVVAAAALVVGVVGVWSVVTRPANSEPAATPPEFVSLMPSDLVPPRPVIDDPAWTLTYLIDDSYDAAIGAVYATNSRFDGPSAVVEMLSDADGGGSIELGPTANVSIGSAVGTSSSDDGAAVVEWIDGQGNRMRVFGVSLAIDTVVEIARTVTVENGRAVFAQLPDGLVAADAAVVDSLGRKVEYQFTGPGSETLDVRTYAGGAFVNRGRVAGEERTEMSVGGEKFLVADQGEGRSRFNVIRGFWAWEFDSAGFASADESLAFLSAIRVVDEQTWQTTLPPSIAGSGNRAADVDALLVDVPVPTNFDADALRNSDSFESRYQFVAAVSGSLVCGWLGIWFDAEAAADPAGMLDAATALASSRSWSMLLEIADQGGWSQVVWEWADAVNGGPGIGSGAGPQPPSRDAARSGLGCQF